MEEIKTVSLKDAEYPALLKKIQGAPKQLYYKGEIKAEELCFAVVGTRRPSDYGKRATLEIAGGLANSGITIVSGLAPGIDTFAHRAALEQNKRTIAVLGTGLDEKSIYPMDNIPLARRIIETGGALISEYPSGTPGSKITFPNRNRIISGLSLGVLVTEAKEKSGSLITANYGFSQKRKVFALPGSVYSSNSKGTNFLIRKGALLVDKAEGIMKELGLPNLKPFLTEKSAAETPEEEMVLSALNEEALHIDKIIEKTKLNAAQVASTLTILEIKGQVNNLGHNIYAIRNS